MVYMSKFVLVTVGTTKFDALIQAIDNVDFLQALVDRGYNKLLVQHGRGSYAIQHIHPSPLRNLTVEYVDSPFSACSIVSNMIMVHAMFEGQTNLLARFVI
jgi:UDP-N-acetylglucosamine transferase subunit ALG13